MDFRIKEYIDKDSSSGKILLILDLPYVIYLEWIIKIVCKELWQLDQNNSNARYGN